MHPGVHTSYKVRGGLLPHTSMSEGWYMHACAACKHVADTCTCTH
jgi:hypothetical protein